MVLVLVSCRWITTFPSSICWRGCLFSIVYFWSLCQKTGGYSCVDWYPAPLVCSTGLHVCFCANTMLFLLLLLCNIVWSQVLWYYHFNLCDESHWDFDGNWKQLRCPTTDKWINKMWYLYTMEFYSAMKKNESLSFESKWMELKNIILSEVSQTQKTKKSYVLPHMWSLYLGQTQQCCRTWVIWQGENIYRRYRVR
jgi:hypothetical protein